MRVLAFIALLLLAVTAAGITWGATANDVLLVINDNSAASKEIGAYYAAKRKIPKKNILHIKCSPEEVCDEKAYAAIEAPIKKYLEKTGLKKTVDYIVLTKGVPIRVYGLRSVDSMLMCMELGYKAADHNTGIPNPYYMQDEHFSKQKYGFYLVTRLDGYTVKDAKALVDRSLAAKPVKGMFLFDGAPHRNSGGYGVMSQRMRQAHDVITKKGYFSFLDETDEFIGNRKNLMGYFSWGSNDRSFEAVLFRSNKFCPGAIGETAVSTSARTMNHTSDNGQSQISDLIYAGITGVKGYVSEPTLAAIADPVILFDRYLSGYNLAESFYMASRWIFWRDVVIGDPLCAPYAKK